MAVPSPVFDERGNRIEGPILMDLGEIIKIIAPYFGVGLIKHTFSILAGDRKPIQVPWNPTRIASILVPSGPVWVGGNNAVSVGPGGSAGFPLAAGQPMEFGPEEGDSPTFLIATSAAVDVRCLEIVPKPAAGP